MKVRVPIKIESIMVVSVKELIKPVFKNSAAATKAEAPPPKPLKIATICGICVISTFVAKRTPIIDPITIPIMMIW